MTTQNQAQANAKPIKLENVRVIFANLNTKDKFGKYGLTIQGTPQQLSIFTTTKDGPFPTVRCAGRPTEKNIIADQEIESGDIVNVLVRPEYYGDSIYPKLLAVRLIEKRANLKDQEEDIDYSDLV